MFRHPRHVLRFGHDPAGPCGIDSNSRVSAIGGGVAHAGPRRRAPTPCRHRRSPAPWSPRTAVIAGCACGRRSYSAVAASSRWSRTRPSMRPGARRRPRDGVGALPPRRHLRRHRPRCAAWAMQPASAALPDPRPADRNAVGMAIDRAGRPVVGIGLKPGPSSSVGFRYSL